MKKLAVIFLLLVYSLSSLGMNLKEFYCCGKLKSVSLAFGDNKKNSCSKGGNDDGCCKTKVHYLKVKDNHLVAAHSEAPAKFFTELHSPAPLWQAAFFTLQEIPVINGSHAPPLNRDVPIYISNRVFRI